MKNDASSRVQCARPNESTSRQSEVTLTTLAGAKDLTQTSLGLVGWENKMTYADFFCRRGTTLIGSKLTSFAMLVEC
jgi:hypothetical protein